MKLRIQGSTLRLRLNCSDVQQFRTSGVCAESLRFDSNSRLTYTLETSSRLTAMEVQYVQDCIRVRLPLDMAEEWAGSDRISLSLNRAGSPSLLLSMSSPRRDEPGRRCGCISESRRDRLRLQHWVHWWARSWPPVYQRMQLRSSSDPSSSA